MHIHSYVDSNDHEFPLKVKINILAGTMVRYILL